MCVQVSLQKLAVVRDDQAAGPKLAEKPFQQHLRAQIEKVGRLVENQQVRIVQQQRGQLGARLPAAGELADRPIEHRRRGIGTRQATSPQRQSGWPLSRIRNSRTVSPA